MNEYDKLFVVSDLHLGGWKENDEKNFQIFNQGKQLAALIKEIAAQSGKIALVLNGDVVDFLAEDKAVYFDPYGAPRNLIRIISDKSFKPVWDALTQLVHTPDKWLIIVLGNHDVELALASVQDVIVRELCRGNMDARGRLHFATGGAGYRCTVSGRHVLCLHGNEVDNWNVVDYRQLLEVERSQNRGMPLPDWQPNAGTKMVIDVMNRIKHDHPFVDLLKPETTLVPGVLLAIKPEIKEDLKRLAPVLYRLAVDSARAATGLLGEEEDNHNILVNEEEAMQRMFRAPFKVGPRGPVTHDVYEKLEQRFTERTDSSLDFEEGLLGWTGLPGIFGTRLFGGDTESSLRESVRQWLVEDKSFHFAESDETFEKLDAAVGPDIDFLIAGHTHLQRSLNRKKGRGVYFNSGTWIRLMRVNPEVIDDDEKYMNLLEVLKSREMKAIDASGYVDQKNTVVRIEKRGDKVRGELLRVPRKGTFQLVPVDGSEREL